MPVKTSTKAPDPAGDTPAGDVALPPEGQGSIPDAHEGGHTEASFANMFNIVREVAVPVLQFRKDSTIYFRPTMAIFKGKAIETERKVRGKDETATTREIPDILRGELITPNSVRDDSYTTFDLVCGTVLRKELQDAYEDDSYVERIFRITKSAREGKNYMNYAVAEVQLNPPAE